jgi:hypothetical protein
LRRRTIIIVHSSSFLDTKRTSERERERERKRERERERERTRGRERERERERERKRDWRQLAREKMENRYPTRNLYLSHLLHNNGKMRDLGTQ